MSWKFWRGRQLKKKVRGAVAKGLYGGGGVIAGEVLQEVPHDVGSLSETVHVFINPDNPLEVALSAGGGPGTGFPEVPYAIRHHEVPANFQKGRKSNYVRDPVKRAKSNQTVHKSVAKELEKVL